MLFRSFTPLSSYLLLLLPTMSARAPFSVDSIVQCHGTTSLKVLYTNTCERVEEWIAKVEAVLAASQVKLVGVDLENTTKLRYSP